MSAGWSWPPPPTSTYVAIVATVGGFLGLTVKTTVLVAAAHTVGPLIGAAVAYEGVSRLANWMAGTVVEIPDVGADATRLSAESGCDPQLLAACMNAAAGVPRDNALALQLKRVANNHLNIHHKDWSEIVRFDQMTRAVNYSMCYSGAEIGRASLWSSRAGYGSIWSATKISRGNIGRLQSLPVA